VPRVKAAVLHPAARSHLLLIKNPSAPRPESYLRACQGGPSRPPAPRMAAAASSRSGRLHTEPSPSPPSLASTKTHWCARHSHRAATPPVSQSRRPPSLAAGAPSSAFSLPHPSPGIGPLGPKVPPPPVPGRRLAVIWSDRRWPAPRDYIANSRIFPGASTQKYNFNSVCRFADSCKLRRKLYIIQKNAKLILLGSGRKIPQLLLFSHGLILNIFNMKNGIVKHLDLP
jgi:hypothetical protein